LQTLDFIDGILQYFHYRIKFKSLLLRQLALTKKMQAKIPHFGAEFLHLKKEKRTNLQ